MDREITFRKIKAGHYVNDETGIEIRRRTPEETGKCGHAGWHVTVPHLTKGSVLADICPTKTLAEQVAVPLVRMVRAAIGGLYADATAEYINRAVAAYDDSDHPESSLNEGGPGTGADFIRAARRAWAAEDYDRAVVFAREAARSYATLRQGQVEADHHDALAEDERRAAEARYFAQHLPFGQRMREYREATRCGLRESKWYAVAEARANAEIEYACRARIAQMAAFDDAAYLSAEFSAARRECSHHAAMLCGVRAIIGRAYDDAVAFEHTATPGKNRP